ncbi:chloride channel protein [Acidithiobacillus sp.]
MPDHRRIHLLGCGVGAGIAAVFNAPLGGWFLAMEVIVPDWRPWTVLSTLVATASASWVTQEGSEAPISSRMPPSPIGMAAS